MQVTKGTRNEDGEMNGRWSGAIVVNAPNSSDGALWVDSLGRIRRHEPVGSAAGAPEASAGGGESVGQAIEAMETALGEAIEVRDHGRLEELMDSAEQSGLSDNEVLVHSVVVPLISGRWPRRLVANNETYSSTARSSSTTVQFSSLDLFARVGATGGQTRSGRIVAAGR
jgi:hypothetical protein